MKKPNVIIILTDDLGYGDLGLYGNKIVKTPNIDLLGQNGIYFSQNYCGSPLCSPSRACLLTGKYNHRVGALSVESNRGLDRISLEEKTMADRFTQDGYITGMVGKWHNGLFDKRHHPNARGFKEFCGFLNGGMDYFNWILDKNGSSFTSDGRYLTDVFTEESIDFIDRHKKEDFFLFLAYNAPHSPLQADEKDIEYYKNIGRFTEEVCIVYAMITAMDRGIGRILEKLQCEKLYDDTIIIFTSDNGPWLAGNEMRYNGLFSGMKQDVLEGGIRVPLIIHWGNGTLYSGRNVGEMIHHCDLTPTLMQACSINNLSYENGDGISILDFIQGNRDILCIKRFWQYNRYEPVGTCNAAMRDQEWKLYLPKIPDLMKKLKHDDVWYQRMFRLPHFFTDTQPDPAFPKRKIVTTENKPILFNILEDPGEKHDLSDVYPDITKKMKLELENWFERVNGTCRNIYETEKRL